jgi:elongation factor Tu
LHSNQRPSEPFFMPIEDVLHVKGQGTAIVGPVERGVLLNGQAVEVIGLQEDGLKITANDLSKSGIGTFTGLEKLETGDYGGILFPHQYQDALKRGMVAVTPGSIRVHNRFKASLYLLSADEGGREKSPMPLVVGYTATHGYRPQICPYVRAYIHYACVIDHPAPQSIPWFELHPGEEAEVIVQLLTLIPLETDWPFSLYQGRQLVGRGIITEVLDNV